MGRKRHERMTAWEKTREVLEDIVLFPLTIALNIVHPGIFRECYPKTRSGIQGAGNRLMMAVILLLLVLPPLVLLAGGYEEERLVWCLAIPTICLMACYAPWYTVVGLIPFWFFYAAVSAIAHGSHSESSQWTVAWFWAWSLYPLLRGMHHILKWEDERKRRLPNHPVTKHPVALAAVSAGVVLGAHYAGKSGKKKG